MRSTGLVLDCQRERQARLEIGRSPIYAPGFPCELEQRLTNVADERKCPGVRILDCLGKAAECIGSVLASKGAHDLQCGCLILGPSPGRFCRVDPGPESFYLLARKRRRPTIPGQEISKRKSESFDGDCAFQVAQHVSAWGIFNCVGQFGRQLKPWIEPLLKRHGKHECGDNIKGRRVWPRPSVQVGFAQGHLEVPVIDRCVQLVGDGDSAQFLGDCPGLIAVLAAAQCTAKVSSHDRVQFAAVQQCKAPPEISRALRPCGSSTGMSCQELLVSLGGQRKCNDGTSIVLFADV